jgi:hypothetical protein
MKYRILVWSTCNKGEMAWRKDAYKKILFNNHTKFFLQAHQSNSMPTTPKPQHTAAMISSGAFLKEDRMAVIILLSLIAVLLIFWRAVNVPGKITKPARRIPSNDKLAYVGENAFTKKLQGVCECL